MAFIPLQGVSAVDKEGAPFHDPEADQACFSSLKANIGDVPVVERDQHINDEGFALAMADRLDELIKGRQ